MGENRRNSQKEEELTPGKRRPLNQTSVEGKTVRRKPSKGLVKRKDNRTKLMRYVKSAKLP